MPFVRFVEDVNKAGRIREGAGMSRNGRPPSMAEAAQLVGVSHQTVSRVVNGKGRVSPRTRAGRDCAAGIPSELRGPSPGNRPLGHYRRRDHDLGSCWPLLDADCPGDYRTRGRA